MLLSPILNTQIYGVNGKLGVGFKIYSYDEGTTDLAPTYTSKEGDVQQANPIILNDYGMPDEPIWLSEGHKYKLVVKDSNDNLLWTYDNISGTNDSLEELGKYLGQEWILGDVPVYLTEKSFYLVGDKTSTYHKFRRLKLQILANFVYGYISSVSYDNDTDRTTINMEMDNDEHLTEFLANTYYSILSYAPQSYPNFLPMAQWQKKGDTLTLASGKVNAWDHSGNFSHVSGTGDVISLGVSPQEGATKYLVFDNIGIVIKNNNNIKTPKGTDLNLVAGDIVEVFGGSGGINLVTLLMSNKASLIAGWEAPLQTRQSCLIGPYKVQNASTEVANYYEIPPMPMTSNSTNGYVASASDGGGGAYRGFNKVVDGGIDWVGDWGWVQCIFPEIFWVDKIYFTPYSDGHQSYNTDISYMDGTVDGINWYRIAEGWSDTQGWITWNIPLQRLKGIRWMGDNHA